MSPLQRVRRTLGVLGLILAVPALASAQGYVTNGVEYAPAGILPGEQVYPDLSVTTSGGYLVWEDNITDGDGEGISAVRVDATFSPIYGNFRVNQNGVADQERPRVAMLKNGGAAFVWQGGRQGLQHINARFLDANGLFINTNDVMVNSTTNFYQSNPAIAALANSNAVVTWASYGQDNADGLQGVYLQLLSPTGQKLLTNGEAPVNQTTLYNQRTPAVAAFPNGGFVIAWVSEQQRFALSVDVYARLYDANGNPTGGEFLVNTGTNICADPTVATASDGTFIIAWCQKDVVITNNSWDVFARRFNGTSGGTVQTVNSQLYGDQYAPKISSIGTDYLVIWTSLAQDGSGAGVYGQQLNGLDASHSGVEFRVNTTIIGHQKYQAVGSDGVGQFLAVWSSYTGGINSMDVMAQRYITTAQPLFPPNPPVAAPLAAYLLSVTWSPLPGFNVDHWNLYVDGSSSPEMTTNTFWQNEGVNDEDNDYNPGSTHTFQLAYVLADGRQSPLSATASGTTWQLPRHGYDLPYDWETKYFGTNFNNWKTSTYQLAPGVTLGMVFNWGANPNDPGTWLVQSIKPTPEGVFLSWNTQPGYVYQVQSASPDLQTWTNLGLPRFAAGTTDSIYLGLSGRGYYRIWRVIY